MLPGFNQNIRALRRILNSVVYHIYDNLHHKLCIHFGKKILFFVVNGYMVFNTFSVYMMKCF